MKALLLFIVTFPVLAFAQKNRSESISHPLDERICNSSFQNIFIGKGDTSILKSYLIANNKNFNSDNVSVEFSKIIESPAGIHFTLDQYYNNIKIYRSQIKVNMDKQGNIKSVFDNSFPVISSLSPDFPSEEVIREHLPLRKDAYIKEPVYFYNEGAFIPAVRLEIATSVENYWEVIIDNEGKVIYQRDMNTYNHAQYLMQDSAVIAKVFLPDPLTTSSASYGAPYIDNSDADVSELNAQIVTINMNADYDSGIFRLESPYAKITEHSNPVTVPATSTSPDFNFTRSQEQFEDVNAFYHVNKYQNYIQSIGFTNLVNYPINIDAHALNGSDNSSFSAFFTPPRLNFGEGGVDDAEDADAIIHEYGHAIMFSAAPNTNSGTERQALDEAMGDYFASSYSKSINPFSSEKVFTWDGHNTFWAGRITNSTKHYPENLNGSIHSNGEIWASTIMQINNDIGREITDEILLQSTYSYASNMSMTQAANLFLQADTLLNNGVNTDVACMYFSQRGLLQCGPVGLSEEENINSSISIINTGAFANGSGGAVLRFSKLCSGRINLYDITGKILLDHSFSGISSYPISPLRLTEGVYFLNVQTPGETVNFKLVKF